MNGEAITGQAADHKPGRDGLEWLLLTGGWKHSWVQESHKNRRRKGFQIPCPSVLREFRLRDYHPCSRVHCLA